jgi:hypothetical protein
MPDNFDFHPAAREAIDKGAVELIEQVAEHQPAPKKQ